MRKREVIPWLLLLALLLAAETGVCEQPACLTIVSTTARVWADLRANPAMASAFAACVGVIVALYFQSRSLQSTRESNSAKMVLDLFARFDSDLMRKHRKNFSALLKTNQSDVDLLAETPVLDMLQDVAHHTRRGILDKDMVRSAFGWWVNGYYRAITTPTNLLVKVREEKKSPSFYYEFEWLYNHVTRPERDLLREQTSAFQDPAVFLPGEMSIRVDEKASQTAS